MNNFFKRISKGYFREKTNIDINSLNLHLDKISDQMIDKGFYGKHGFLKIVTMDETIMKLAGDKIVKIINDEFNIPEVLLKNSLSSSLYFTNDEFKTTHRNQIAHFDHIRKLKVFLYLDDVDEYTGPTEFAPNSSNKLFMKFCRFFRYIFPIGLKGMNNIIFWKLFENTLSFSKAIGQKGDIYIFDTDTVHKAGVIIDKNKIRKLLRFDFQLQKHQQNFFTRNFIRAFYKVNQLRG